MLFYSFPSPHSKLLAEFFKNLFPPRQKRLEEAMICSVKIQSQNMKMTSNMSLFPLGMIAIFLNVMTLQYCKQDQIVYCVLLLPLPLPLPLPLLLLLLLGLRLLNKYISVSHLSHRIFSKVLQRA